MKSCKNCKGYEAAKGMIYKGICKLHGGTKILRTLDAQYCDDYQERRKLPAGKVKCWECKRINERNWCTQKKRCFNERERQQERKCIYFKAGLPIELHRVKKVKQQNKKKSCNNSRHG